MIYNFEKLEIWLLSRELILHTFNDENFSIKIKFDELLRQLRKSCISISSNIAEGTARKSIPDKKRFISIAYGSAIEALSQIIICNELTIIIESKYIQIRNILEKLIAKISAFYNSIDIKTVI